MVACRKAALGNPSAFVARTQPLRRYVHTSGQGSPRRTRDGESTRLERSHDNVLDAMLRADEWRTKIDALLASRRDDASLRAAFADLCYYLPSADGL
jgi:hypothetical protein